MKLRVIFILFLFVLALMTSVVQCFNCQTTVTPFWRKGDKSQIVCNACGLYYKLHGSARPISMKSDVIRRRSRHGARRGGVSASTSDSAIPDRES
ncbi:hypothetical protein C8J57DRAFT_1283087 [Mycena rebaudengoi]|nr:hypothetical protein C8J57DRAFT_1283087 [Mycena rebaudengoi]